jgi:primosomal protein N' (replication factor Y) (superfamily II helicase)
MSYADVCVNTPLGRRIAGETPGDAEFDPLGQAFTYAIPARLSGRLQPGHLVWVPFRGRRLQAVVLSLSDTAPLFETHEVISLVWAQPLLTSTQLSLAHWISEYYLAPLIEALRLMLPAGLSKRGRTVLARTGEPAPDALTPTQAALLARIAEAEGTWAEVSEGLRGTTQRADLEPLIARGLVSWEVSFPTPPPRPKTDRQVRLLVDAQTATRVLPTLGRSTRQADVLAWLAEQAASSPGPARSFALDQVRKAVGCTAGPVQALSKRGWVEIAHPSPEGPLRVSLALPLDAVPDALIALRGAEKHRAVLEALQHHDGPAWIGWVYATTGAVLQTLRDLEEAGLITIAEEMVWRDPLAGQEFTLDRAPVLTEDQERAWEIIAAAQQPAAFLLFGVTGSGKTEIYLRAIARALEGGQQAVVLVPEIALTPQTIRRFAARFQGKVTVWHSELGEGERFDVWRRVRTNHPAAQVIVGSRSALFLPYPSLGVIILDEEHETSYKQERTPRYHARTVAVEMGRIYGAPVLLGSATPALETYYSARSGETRILALPKRIIGFREPASVAAPLLDLSGDLPKVQVVDMRQELRAGNRSIFSRALSSAMTRILASGQQAILYLNRRGASTFVMCRDCGHVEACPRCAVPLTFHGQEQTLICHHCSRRYPVPVVCVSCGSKRIRYFGSGTEKVEEAVKTEFPTARTLRWDRDVTGAKGAHDAILDRFIAHRADVLIGTQMIAKGLDLPLVTLVGVVAADTGLFLPDFRASERTFQLLTQVAGRAGRSTLGGQVVVQTYHPDHYAIVAASHHDYEEFYRKEMAFRREQGYPPIRRLARMVFHHTQRAAAQVEATRMAQQLSAEIERLALQEADLIGPAPCFFGRQRDTYRWHVILRAPNPALLLRRLPIPFGWRLDIDPVDLL